MADEKNRCDVESLKEPFRTLIQAAILAPSGDNTQPWRFEVDDAESTITICVDETRDRSPMNAGQRMARIACGAALENIVRTANFNGWGVGIDRYLPTGRGVAVRVAAGPFEAGRIEDCIRQRATRRELYDSRPASPEIVHQLQSCAMEGRGSRMLWITDQEVMRRIAAQIAQCDAIMFGEPRFLHAFLDNIRWDLQPNEVAEYGLGPGTLGLTDFEKATLSVVGGLPDWILRREFCRAAYRRKARANICSSSGVWILLTDEASSVNDFILGRLMQRAWLRLTSEGLIAQPMMSLPVLLSSIQFDSAFSHETAKTVRWIHDQFRETAEVGSQITVAAIMRFGYTEKAAHANGRRSLESITKMTSPGASRVLVTL
jgi:hypothetical protein